MPYHIAFWECDRRNCAAGWRIDSSWQEDDDRQCSNWTRVFPWFSIQHNAWSFEVWQSGCPENWRIEKKWTESVCPCNISYGMQIKEKICITVLLLETNYRSITTNPYQCSGIIPVHFQAKSLRRMPSSGMWRRVDLVWTDDSEERIASIFRVERFASEGAARAVACSLQVTFRRIGNCFSLIVRTILKTEYALRETLMKTGPVRDAQQTKQCAYSIPCDRQMLHQWNRSTHRGAQI
jgi:hypothetical protein